jgi:hypothetical protein
MKGSKVWDEEQLSIQGIWTWVPSFPNYFLSDKATWFRTGPEPKRDWRLAPNPPRAGDLGDMSFCGTLSSTCEMPESSTCLASAA